MVYSRNMVVRRFGVSLLISILLVASGCVGRSRIATVSDEPVASQTMAPSIYYEDGKLIFFAVNTHLAKFNRNGKLIPVEIAIANKGLKKLTVSAERITLRSLDGSRWPVVAPEESAGSSLRSSFDRKLMPVAFDEVVKLRFSTFRHIPSTFGLRGGNLSMTRTAEMPRHTWTLSQIWFPNPGGELKGRLFEVWFEAAELPDPVFTTVEF